MGEFREGIRLFKKQISTRITANRTRMIANPENDLISEN
jgi:hypothetical protein